MTGTWLRNHQEALTASLLDGTYQPHPVRGAEFRKPDGGMRQLGIPTVADRLVQQAILQVMNPIIDPTFSNSSYGFRPARDPLARGEDHSAYLFTWYSFAVDPLVRSTGPRLLARAHPTRLPKKLVQERLHAP